MLLGIIAVAASLFLMKDATSVMVPMVFALFFVAVFWPLYNRLCKPIGRVAAAIVSLLGLLAFLTLLFGSLWYSATLVAERAASYDGNLGDAKQRAVEWASSHGLPTAWLDGSGALLHSKLDMLFSGIGAFVGGGTLAIGFFLLALLEVRQYGRRVEIDAPDRYRRVRAVMQRVSRDFMKYVVVRTAIGLVTGALAMLIAHLLGLDLVFVWGASSFLLNYIPTIGSVIAVVPPALFALVQHDAGMAIAALGAFGGMQIAMGNYIDPLLQGKYLKLSPLVVLFVVSFWGWLWGVVGALLAVPLTVFLVLVCREFAATRFIAHALASMDFVEHDEGSILSEQVGEGV